MRLSIVLFIAAIITVSIGCTRRSSSDSERKPDATLANLNAAAQASPTGEAAPATAEASPADAASATDIPAPPTASPGPTRAPFRIPGFVDMAKGVIVDLPQYPNSRQINVQYGPLQGAGDSAMVMAQTTDPIEKVRAFYEKVIRGHNWTVTSQVSEPENYKWRLKKGEVDEGV
ncbi:MAG TPA: hypothetical protein VJQ56_06445, partial [Blastocatellia bacterium]|nr:hypothetical protein [Blastocatellia bacterium]